MCMKQFIRVYVSIGGVLRRPKGVDIWYSRIFGRVRCHQSQISTGRIHSRVRERINSKEARVWREGVRTIRVHFDSSTIRHDQCANWIAVHMSHR